MRGSYVLRAVWGLSVGPLWGCVGALVRLCWGLLQLNWGCLGDEWS